MVKETENGDLKFREFDIFLKTIKGDQPTNMLTAS